MTKLITVLLMSSCFALAGEYDEDVTNFLNSAQSIPFVDTEAGTLNGYVLGADELGDPTAEIQMQAGDVLTEVNELKIEE